LDVDIENVSDSGIGVALNLLASLLSDSDRWLFYEQYLGFTVFAVETRIYALWYRHCYMRWPHHNTREDMERWSEREGRVPAWMELFLYSGHVGG
jgi:hypothetical protein